MNMAEKFLEALGKTGETMRTITNVRFQALLVEHRGQSVYEGEKRSYGFPDGSGLKYGQKGDLDLV